MHIFWNKSIKINVSSIFHYFEIFTGCASILRLQFISYKLLYLYEPLRKKVTKRSNPSTRLVRCLTFSLKSHTNEVLATSKLSHDLKDPRKWESGFVPRWNKRTMHEHSLIKRHLLQYQGKCEKLFFPKKLYLTF